MDSPITSLVDYLARRHKQHDPACEQVDPKEAAAILSEIAGAMPIADRLRAYREMKAALLPVPYTVACEHCGADVGEECTETRGWGAVLARVNVEPHAERWKAAEEGK